MQMMKVLSTIYLFCTIILILLTIVDHPVNGMEGANGTFLYCYCVFVIWLDIPWIQLAVSVLFDVVLVYQAMTSMNPQQVALYHWTLFIQTSHTYLNSEFWWIQQLVSCRKAFSQTWADAERDSRWQLWYQQPSFDPPPPSNFHVLLKMKMRPILKTPVIGTPGKTLLGPWPG